MYKFSTEMWIYCLSLLAHRLINAVIQTGNYNNNLTIPMPKRRSQLEIMAYLDKRKDSTPADAFLYLARQGLVQWRTLDQFYDDIATTQWTSEESKQKFQKILLQYLKKYFKQNTGKQFPNFHIPHSINEGNEFYEHIINLYINQFLDEQQQCVAQQAEEEYPIQGVELYTKNLGKDFNKIQSQSCNYLDQKPLLPQKQKKENKNSTELVKLISQTTNKKSKPQIPTFLQFDKKGNPRKSIRILFSFILVEEFKQEAEQVKRQIQDQLERQDNYIGKIFTEFINNMQQIWMIKTGTQESKIQNSQQMVQYIKFYQKYLSKDSKEVYFSSKSESQLLKYWNNLHIKITQACSSCKITTNIIQDILKESLQQFNLIFYFTPLMQKGVQYAATSCPHQRIYINVNHYQAEKSIKEFKETVFKPYLFLMILHQLGHITLRALQIATDTQSSLQCFQTCNGANILRIAFNIAKEIKIGWSICQIENQSRQARRQIVVKKIEQIYNFSEKHSAVINALRDNLQLFMQIKRVILSIDAVQSMKNKIEREKIWSNHFHTICESIKTLKGGPCEVQLKLRRQQIAEYKFILALFVSDSIINAVDVSKNPDYLKKIQKLRNLQSYQQLFLLNSEQFSNLSTKITQIKTLLEKSKHGHFFTEFFLLKDPFEQLQKKMSRLNQAIDSDQIRSFFGDLSHIKELNPKVRLDGRFAFKSYIKDQCYDKFISICQVFQMTNLMLKFLKYSEILLISSTIPDIIMRKDQPRFDSGFYLQQLLLPNFKQVIYTKDYLLFKALNPANALEIGKSENKIQKNNNRVLLQRKATCIDERDQVNLSGLRCTYSSNFHRRTGKKEDDDETAQN